MSKEYNLETDERTINTVESFQKSKITIIKKRTGFNREFIKIK